MDGAEEFCRGGEERGEAAEAVLCLGEEIGGDPVGIGGVVGKDEDFTGAGEKIEGDASEELAFGFDDPGAAGAEDFADGADGAGAEGEGGDGLGAADPVNLVDSAVGEGGEEGGVDAAFGISGCDGCDAGDSCFAGESGGHDGRGDEGRGAAGNVKSHTGEGIEAFADDGTLAVAHEPGFTKAAAGEGGDVVAGGDKGFLRGGGESGECGGDFAGGDGEIAGAEFAASEFLMVIEEGFVAGFFDGFEDFADGFFDFAVGGGAAIELTEAAGVVFVGGTEDEHGGI